MKKIAIFGQFFAKNQERKKNEPFSYFCAYLSISNLIKQSITVKKQVTDSEGMCEKQLPPKMKKMAIFGQFLAKNQEKLVKRAFFIFKSIIEHFKPNVKKQVTDSEGVCEKRLALKMKRIAIFGKFLAKIKKKRKTIFFIFKSIIEQFKHDETVHNCEKVGHRQ